MTALRPDQIPNLELSLNVNVGVDVISGAAAQWEDQSSNGFDFVSGLGFRPTYLADAGDGLPALSFDGVSQRFDARAVIPAASAHSIFIECAPRASDARGCIPVVLGSSSGPAHLALVLDPTFENGCFVRHFNNAGVESAHNKRTSIARGYFGRFLMRNDLGGTERLRAALDVSDVTTTTSSPTTTNRMAIGASYFGGEYRGSFVGFIRSIYVYSRAITDDEWASLIAFSQNPNTQPPTIQNFSPAPGSPISRTDMIVFDVTDDLAAMRRAIITARFPNGLYEVVHDGDQFAGGYISQSSRTAIAGGFRFSLRRSGGWPGNPTIVPFAYDTSGNEIL